MSASIPTSAVGRAMLPEPIFRSFFGLVRHIAAGGLAGIATGIVVGGVGGRLFMRIAGAAARDAAQGARTEAGFTVGEVTFGGTVALVLFIGVFTGIVGAALYLIFRPWLSWAGRWMGVLYGVVLSAAGSATSDVMNPDNPDFFIFGNPALLVVLISALFLAFGLVLDALFRFLDARLPNREEGWRVVGVPYAAISAVGILVVSGLPSLPTRCDGFVSGPPSSDTVAPWRRSFSASQEP